MRVGGSLAGIWGVLQLVAHILTTARVIPSSYATWWIPQLLAGSALEEILICLSCCLLFYRATSAQAKHAYFCFALFISGEC